MIKRQSTKQLLFDSLCELCKKKNIDEISISDITSNCGMKRGIFYYYFTDKEDMIFSILEQNTHDIYSNISSSISWDAFIYHNLLFCKNHKSLCTHLLNPHISFTERVSTYLQNYILTLVQEYYHQKTIDWKTCSIVQFYCAGFTNVLRNWIKNDFEPDIEEVTSLLREMVPPELLNILNIPKTEL